jgi:aconitase B
LRDQVRERSTRFVLASPSRPVCRALGAAGVWELFEHESIWSEHPTSELST